MTASREVPWLLLGDARRVALETKLATLLSGWIAQWSVRREVHVKVEGTAELAKAWTEAPAARWRIGPGYEASAIVVCRAGFAQELLGGHGSNDLATANGPIAAGLQEQLMESLCNHLARHLDARDGVSCREDSGTLRDCLQDAAARRWVGAAIQVASNRPLGLLLLDPNVVARLLPVPALGSTAERLERRAAAVHASAVEIEVVLGDADVLLADLADIAVDDVIVLNQSLGSPVQLVCNGARVVAAHLGRAGDRLAVSVDG